VYRIVDGNEDYALVHVNLMIRDRVACGNSTRGSSTNDDGFKRDLGHRTENSYIFSSVGIKKTREGVAQIFHNIPGELCFL